MIGSGNRAVVGVFSYLDDVMCAVREAQARRWEYRVYSPCPVPELEELTMQGRSPVRLFTSGGALSGLILGFAAAIWCSMDFPLRVSAKPIVSIPAFVPVGYECTILGGALATFLGLLIFCRLPYVFRKMGYDPRFSNDKFGVVVACGWEDVVAVGEVLRQSGADEVNVKNAL